MASIFKAVDAGSGSVVALKVPYFQYESDVVFYERFRREEQIGQQLDHPGIVKVLPAGEKSRMYLAMEYVPGVPLRAIMTGQPIAAQKAIDLACQVGEALAHMHARGVVHRDIKPDNLIVTIDGRVKISDFGIALSRGARRLTWSGLSHSTGTPDYAAPEQIRGERGDARTDVYALGVLVYELLTGRLPWEAPDLRQLLRAKRKIDPTPPHAHCPAIDPALETVVLRAISRHPTDRQADAAELVADLRNPFAMTIRPPRRTSLLARRARALIVAAGVAALGTLAFRCGVAGRKPGPGQIVRSAGGGAGRNQGSR